MEILPVSTSNSTAVEDLTLRAGNPIKEIFQMNLPDHMSVLTISRWRYYLTPASSMTHAHSASKQKECIRSESSSTCHYLFCNSDNHEFPQYHQRTSNPNKNCSMGKIVSLDEEEENASFQDKYKHVGQRHKMIKKVKSR
ncbi:hypothetical protein Tco_1299404 [Tanacetum coccineum]